MVTRSAHCTPTEPEDYAREIRRYLIYRPDQTLDSLASKIKKPVKWLMELLEKYPEDPKIFRAFHRDWRSFRGKELTPGMYELIDTNCSFMREQNQFLASSEGLNV